MRKIVTVGCVVAVLAAGGVAAFLVAQDKPAGERPAAASRGRSASSGNESPAIVPSSPNPEDSERVKRLKEVNQAIFEVTQEAARRPKDQRMTPEEISALVRARIQELAANR